MAGSGFDALVFSLRQYYIFFKAALLTSGNSVAEMFL
jgi:hypothetical protein